MGLTPDSFQSIRFSSPGRILSADRLMLLAAEIGAAGAHGGMTEVSFEWARRTRRMKEELDMYLEIQTFLPRPDLVEGPPHDPAEFEHAVKVAKETTEDLWAGRTAQKDDSSRSGFISYGDFGPPPRPRKSEQR